MTLLFIHLSTGVIHSVCVLVIRFIHKRSYPHYFVFRSTCFVDKWHFGLLLRVFNVDNLVGIGWWVCITKVRYAQSSTYPLIHSPDEWWFISFFLKIVFIHHKKEAWAFGRILLTLSALFAKPYSLGFVGLPIQHCQTILTNRTL